MKRSVILVTVVVAVSMVVAAADRPVAMLVETEIRGSLGDDTVVAITVQAAPEDRRRLGRDIWIQVELSRGGERLDRLARPADLDDDGRATIEVAWPTGDYRLRVEIEGAGTDVSGLWIGPVNVPAPGSTSVAATPIPEPTPAVPATSGEAAAGVAAAAAAAGQPEPPTPAPHTPTPEPRNPKPEPMATSTWSTDEDSTDVTVMVTDRNRPVLGLDRAAFTLRVGGKEVTIEGVGNSSAAPLNLGLTVSVPTSAPDDTAEVNRLITRFAHRSSAGTGSIMLVTESSTSPEWESDIGGIIEAAAAAKPAGELVLADLLTTSLGAFRGQRGRSALVLVTDGEDRSVKTDWKAALTAADEAGVPVFVIGLRDTGFPSKTRGTLGRLADSTGGRSYFLGDPSMLQMTLDYIGELISGSYALRFSDPAAGSGAPRPIKVEVATKGWKVHAPGKIRPW